MPVGNEYITVTFRNMKKITDPCWGEEWLDIHFSVKNNYHETIEVQAKQVVADNVPVDQSMIFMSDTIDCGKSVDVTLSIQNYHGPLPPMKRSLDIMLHVFTWNIADFNHHFQVKMTF